MTMLNGPLRLSNSEMSTWRECKRRWWFAFYLRKGTGEPGFGRPTGLGTRVHNALETLYAAVPDGEPLPDPFERLKADYEADLEEYPGYVDDIEKDYEFAVIMIEGYLQWLEETGADIDLRVVEPEAKLMVELDNTGDVILLSKQDARVERRSDGTRLALEHKSVASLKQPLPLLQIDPQLLTEHLTEYLLLLKEGGDPERRASGVLYNMIRKVKRSSTAKPPFFGREEVRHNTDELRNHWKHVRAIANEIIDAHRRLDAGEEHHFVAYPTPTRDCTWKCDFFNVCALADDGSDLAGALNDAYQDVDPLARYTDSVPEGGTQA